MAWYYVNSSNQLQRDAGDYAANMLYKTKVADENGYTTTEYKDKLGQVVMKQRTLSTSVKVNTYYVYNDLGQLGYVLPPLAADALTAGVIADNAQALVQYGYLYKYDEWGNNIEKRLPGCDPIYMIYDKANRLVLSQDGNQRDKSRKPIRQWTVIKSVNRKFLVLSALLSEQAIMPEYQNLFRLYAKIISMFSKNFAVSLMILQLQYLKQFK